MRSARRAYFVHLTTVVIFITAVSFVGAGILSTPTYVFLQRKSAELQQTSSVLSIELSTRARNSVKKQIRTLNKDTVFLSTLGTQSMASRATASVLDVPHKGVTLTDINYTAPKKDASATMMLSGKAANRTVLHDYQKALTTPVFIKNVNLPVSAYAKDTNIPFTITITFSKTPLP